MSLRQNVQAGFGVHSDSYATSTGILSQAQNSQGIKAYLHQVLRLRVGGATPLFHVYSLIARTGTA